MELVQCLLASLSKHIDDIIFLGSKVYESLTEIHFEYLDNDYDAHNGMIQGSRRT
jgi:hypothetical protein